MDWRKHIHSDPKILVGKPAIKNTRLSVDFILNLLAEGWTQKQILENYTSLNQEVLQAVYAFASECLKDETIFEMPPKVA